VTEELRVHWELHETDEQSVSREQQLARHPELRRAHEAKVAAARAVLAAIDQRLATALQRRRALERDITAFDVQQKHFEQQLQAVTDQSSTSRAARDRRRARQTRYARDEALELLEQEERESKLRPEKAHVLERAESESRTAFEALDSEAVKLRGELAALEAERQRACAQLPPAFAPALRAAAQRALGTRGGRDRPQRLRCLPPRPPPAGLQAAGGATR
jgi:predicted  nucleic acid-binding Zn-ribbon protein